MRTSVLLLQPAVTLVPGELCRDSPLVELAVGFGLFPRGFLPLIIPRSLEVPWVVVSGDFAGSSGI